ncbi:MAG: acetate--CoA ligase family protein [Vannielia sp.]|uniref:acetate--CoA ligase family protein n=1 Tax=Vannielia sp. TaxID=2813045 RepID=UPI003B8CB648
MMGRPEAEFLKALTAPRAVALVGASSNPKKLTARPLTFLRQHGFQGRIIPVNPGSAEVMGLPAAPSVTEIHEPVDHAYILLDADPALSALEQCATKGVAVVSMLADGFAEAGPEGLARQERAAAIARDAGILLIGPNSTGTVSTASGFACTTNAAFATPSITRGHTAVLSQSGSVIGTLLSRGQERGHGFSTLVSLGNEARTGVGTLGQLLLDDPDTHAFQLFLETIRDAEALEVFARAAARRGKPVVAYMIGASEEGRQLAVSHTGALTGGRAAVSAFLREIGIHEAQQFDTLIEAPRALSRARLPEGRPRRATVISTTGGGGAMVIDQLAARGVEIGGLSEAARAELSARNIPLGHGKLVDVTLAGTKYETMRAVVDRLIRDPETGVLVVAVGSSAQFNPELAVAPIVDAVKDAPEGAAPVMGFPLPHAPESLALLDAAGIPNFRNLETCAETTALLLRAPPAPKAHPEPLPPALTEQLATLPGGLQSEATSGALFESLGLARPQTLLLGPDAPLPEPLGLAFPLVAKLVSPDLPHKSEAGAVALKIATPEALASAITRMKAAAEAHTPGYRLHGVLVQEMRPGLGEAIIGLTRDPLVGPVVTVGAGGVLTEIYRDSATRCAPVTLDTAREMVDAVKGFAPLRGYRGSAEGDLEALARAVATFSRLALAPDIEEAEVNPVAILAPGAGVVMLDALIRLREDAAT